MIDRATRCGFAAVVGAPNAGKSTLVNALVGAKVSIVSPKVQTTRMPVRGVAIRGDTQIVFVDTPGIFKPRRRFDRAMVDSAWNRTREADVLLLVVDAPALAAHPDGAAARDTQSIIDGLRGDRKPSALLLNKIDGLSHSKLLPLIQQMSGDDRFAEVFMISALAGDRTEDVAAWTALKMPVGPWLYPEDQSADIPLRLLAAEITREKVYLRLHDELPYATMVETETWEERRDGSVKIDQIVYVQRESQKPILLGKGGRTIKAIGELARKEMEEILGQRVHLFLFAKVRENWTESREHYASIGLEYPEG